MKMYCILKNIILVWFSVWFTYLSQNLFFRDGSCLSKISRAGRQESVKNKQARKNKQTNKTFCRGNIWEIFRQGLKIFFFLIFFRKINMAYVISTFSKKMKKKEILKRNKKTKKN